MIISRLLPLTFCTSAMALAVACQSTGTSPVPSTMFKITDDVIPFGNGLKKKWGGAIIGDLDQDGWDDVMTTDHADKVRIFWNDQGVFSEPVTLIKGDTHGLGVSDFDSDGVMDVVITLGGGNGGNPRRPVHYTIAPDRTIDRVEALDHFASTRGRSIKFLDADEDSALDLFYTGFAPRNAPKLSTNQLYRNVGGEFVLSKMLTAPEHALSFRATATDLNNDGHTDVIVHGGLSLTYSQGRGDGTFLDATDAVFGDLAQLDFANNIAEIDFDNDGDVDLFFSRAPLQFGKEVYFDPIEGNLAFFAFNGAIDVDDFTIEGDVLKLENIQETYATHGVFLGEDRNQIEPGINEGLLGNSLIIKSSDAAGWPEGDTPKGLQIGYLGNGQWRIGGQVRSRIAGVVKNITSNPTEIKRAPLPPRLLENRDGRFVDVTEDLGLTINEQVTQAAAGDFDNDGDMDLAIIPYGNMALPGEPFVLINEDGASFRREAMSGLISEEIGATGSSIVTLDFDQDGWLDLIFGNERGRWYLAENLISTNLDTSFLAVKVLTSPETGAQAAGARVDISACGKRQSQNVGAGGDGFHHMLKDRLHFGLGYCAAVESVHVTWTNGEQRHFSDIAAGSVITTAD